ncbi:MAG: ATP-binding protein [Chloroflexi bacterium]|nr:ATP-binding protein [Chloroflexota bacterium]
MNDPIATSWAHKPSLGQLTLPTYSERFLESYAGKIVTSPLVALVELVANSWDAGAVLVDLTWPDEGQSTFRLSDNGVGMKHDDVWGRWLNLSYNRQKAQGENVVFPPTTERTHRKAFGRNGKGRLALFAYCDQYVLTTWRDGLFNSYRVALTSGGTVPYSVDHIETGDRDGSGTMFEGTLVRNHLSPTMMARELAMRFIIDPKFMIQVNGRKIDAGDQGIPTTAHPFTSGPFDFEIKLYAGSKSGRLSGYHGVAWWVNSRLVGTPSWNRLAKGRPYLDARTTFAKRHTIIVEADGLANHVLDDWSGFDEDEVTTKAIDDVEGYVAAICQSLVADLHREQKTDVLRANAVEMRALPPGSRHAVGELISEMQRRVPTIDEDVLSATVAAASNILNARSGHALLRQLADLSLDDLDGLHRLLANWTVQEIRIIVDELQRRLDLVKKLEEVTSRSSDELHEVQPLFDTGLWIFGPEYDGISFMSNRALATVIKKYFAKQIDVSLIEDPASRPDIVVTSDMSLRVFARDHYDDTFNVSGFETVLLLELKRGGHTVNDNNVFQAMKYAAELRRTNAVQADTKIVCMILGSKIAWGVGEMRKPEQNIRCLPRDFQTVLRQAHARTFNILRQIEDANGGAIYDSEVEAAIMQAPIPFEEI